jgi:hypothetical protein
MQKISLESGSALPFRFDFFGQRITLTPGEFCTADSYGGKIIMHSVRDLVVLSLGFERCDCYSTLR